MVVRRRADRAFEEEGPVLCGALDGMRVGVDGVGYRVYCRYATEHRCGVVVREEGGGGGGGGGGLSDQVEGTDPLKDGLVLRRSVALGVGVDGIRSAAGVWALPAVFPRRNRKCNFCFSLECVDFRRLTT